MRNAAQTVGVWAGLFLIAVLAWEAGAAPEASVNDRILRNELRQQQIRATTHRVAEQLDLVVGEFDRNGIVGEDVEVLKRIRLVLEDLTETQMNKVVGLLQQARGERDPLASRRRVADAVSGQQNIIIQFKQLIHEYERQQALYLVSLRLKELAMRQSANMRRGVALARETEGKALGAFGDEEELNRRLQEIEQGGVRAEVELEVVKLKDLMKEVSDGPTAERARAGINEATRGGLLEALSSADAELRSGRMLSAAGSEKRARDQMREVARLLIWTDDPVETLRQALRDLDKVMEQQRATLAKTRGIAERDDGIGAESLQAEVVDMADLIHRDVESIAPVGANHLRQSIDHMQDARGVLMSERDPKKQLREAPPKQEDALVELEQARQALHEQLAKAEATVAEPSAPLKSLQELREQVRELARRQEGLKSETAAAARDELAGKASSQGALRDAAQELQEKSARPAEAAAESLGEAARQMGKAQVSLAGDENNGPAQQAALDALERADHQLGEEIARLEEATDELARLEELLGKVGDVIEEQQDLRTATAVEEAKERPLAELSKAQGQLSGQTGRLQEQASPRAPGAAADLARAQGHMQKAESALGAPAPQGAQSEQTEALADLYEAKQAIQDRVGDLQEMLGAQQNNASLAEAAALIQEAQERVEEAREALDPSSGSLSGQEALPSSAMQRAAQQLGQAESKIGPLAAGQKGALPAAVESALQAAQGDLSAGTGQASAGQREPAQSSAESAAQSLAQAQAALALAQAGVTPDSALAKGQGQGQGQGKGQGQGQGKGQGQGQGQGQGEGQGQGQGQAKGQGTPGPQGTGRDGNWAGAGGADGPRRALAGTSAFTRLPARDRAAIRQSQAERYPQEYGPLVEQYLKNLSDQAGKQ